MTTSVSGRAEVGAVSLADLWAAPPIPFAERVQAVFDANPLPIHYAPIGHTARLYVHAQPDPLLPAVTRFVAARPFTGPRALMRRFSIGLHAARWLLINLEQQGVVRGHWSRLMAAGSLGGGPVYSFRVYRVQSWAWRSLQGVHDGA